MAIIEIENLSHVFADGTMGLGDISIAIEAGTFVVIAGPNGSGKTTLLRHLNGLIPAQKGRVCVSGFQVGKNLKLARQVVGMVFQDANSQIVGETVYDDVAFGPENLCLERTLVKQKVRQALTAVGLSGVEDKRPHLLSGGEKRRLAIAGVLAMDPKVLVLDEPFSNLDYPGALQILKQIIALHRNGHTIIITTHELEKVIAHADRLIILSEGVVARDGKPADVVADVERFGVRKPCCVRMGMGIESWLN